MTTKNKEIRKVTLWGAAVNFTFGILKIIYGSIAGSQALVADGAHSLSDLATDFIVLAVSHKSGEEADEEHPYGHARFETVGSAILSIILLSTAAIIAWENINILILGKFSKSFSYLTLAITLISIFAKEILFYVTLKIGKKYKSSIIIANAWHTRSDSLSSIAVLIGIIFNLFNVLWMDNVAALIVSAILAHIGFDIIKSSFHVLTDRQINPEKITAIKQVIMKTPGIVDYHNLRTRYMGERIFIDLNAQVAPQITVSEGHEIAVVLTKNLLEYSKDIQDVTVHIDVEDDQEVPFHNYHSKSRPLRHELTQLINEIISAQFSKKIQDYRLSYLSNKIQIDVIIQYSEKDNNDLIEMNKLREHLKKEYWYGNLQLVYIKNF